MGKLVWASVQLILLRSKQLSCPGAFCDRVVIEFSELVQRLLHGRQLLEMY